MRNCHSWIQAILWLAWLSSAGVALAQEAPAEGTVDTSFHVPIGRPVLVTGTKNVEWTATFKLPSGEQKRSGKATDEVEFVDEFLEGGDAARASRTIVKAFSTEDGEISDPPFNGLTLEFTQKDSVQIKLADDRLVPKTDLDALLRTSGSVGFWVAFPSDARVGQSRQIDLSKLATVLLSNDLEENSARSILTLEAFDPATAAARFRGKATLVEKGNLEGLASTITYECDCAIDTVGSEGRIASLSMSGNFKMEGSGPVSLQGTGTYSAEFKTQIGSAAVAARKKKPVYRERVQRVEPAGVSLMLPSYWAEIEGQEVKPTFRRLLDSKGIALVAVKRIDEPCPDPKVFHQNILDGLKKTYKDVKVEKITSPLAAGQAYSFTDEAGGTKASVRSELYPLGSYSILVKLIAEPKAFSTAVQELAKSRKSLKRLDER